MKLTKQLTIAQVHIFNVNYFIMQHFLWYTRIQFNYDALSLVHTKRLQLCFQEWSLRQQVVVFTHSICISIK